MLGGVHGRLGAVGRARLHQDAPDVVGGGVGADVKPGADLLVAEAAGKETKDLDLPIGEAIGQRRPLQVSQLPENRQDPPRAD
jgi:hypothetical protein